MIILTRLNGNPILVNPDLIKFVEPNPDTTLSLVTGEKLIVRESCETLTELIASWRSLIFANTWPTAAHALAAKAATSTD